MTTFTKTTIPERARLAYEALNDLSLTSGEVFYIAIGQNSPWAANDTLVQQPIETINYINQTYRNMVAMKKVSQSQASVVARRVDWVGNTKYIAYTDTDEMYSYSLIANANGTVTTNGTTTIVGTNTTFLLDFSVNELINLPGDGINVLPTQYEIVGIASNTSLTVNANTIIVNTNVAQSVQNTYPFFSRSFYVRNSYDQVFICLGNNFGSISNTMPAISIGGQLPGDSYMITADGYLWKYLYTISGGAKQLFFNSEWMPVSIETQVTSAAVAGRLDVIKILNGGTGYNNSQASFSAPILSVQGDGSQANLTAQVDGNGTITAINIINAGSGYTTANITANGGATGSNANIQALIGPPGGWGSNAALELGATTVMFSMTLTDTENATIPTVDSLGDFFTYRQITLVQNPALEANGFQIANGTNYDLTSAVAVSTNTPFAMNDLAYQSPDGTFAKATFVATIVWFDNTTNELHLNNLSGTYAPQSQIYGTKSANSSPYTAVACFNLTESQIEAFSGEVLFIENRNAIQRAPGQTENIKLVIGF